KLAAIDPSAQPPKSDAGTVIRPLDFTEVPGLKVIASVPRAQLKTALGEFDRAVAVTGVTVVTLATIIAIVLARSLSRPIVALARETREVVSGEPRQVRGRGGREIAMLADAFNRTIDELT